MGVQMKQRLTVSWYRRFARARGLLDTAGVSGLPGVAALRRLAKWCLFPGLYERELVVIRTRGVQLAIPYQFTYQYIYRDYEPVTTSVFLAAIERRSIIVDVGAHLGYYSCLASRATGPRGVVYAVEPFESNVKCLQRNISLNAIKNVVVCQIAASNTSGRRKFHVTHSSDSHGFYEHPVARTLETIEVAVEPLDLVIERRAHVIKIDVEGAEIEVLGGMRQLLERSPGATVIVEWNPACLKGAGHNPMDLPRFLQELGLRDISVLDDQAGHVKALAEVECDVREGRLGKEWYANLVGKMN